MVNNTQNMGNTNLANLCCGDNNNKPKQEYRQPEDHKNYTMIVAIYHKDIPRITMMLSVGFDYELPITNDLRNSVELAIEVGHMETLKIMRKFRVNF
jgi:hypothetical protein